MGGAHPKLDCTTMKFFSQFVLNSHATWRPVTLPSYDQEVSDTSCYDKWNSSVARAGARAIEYQH